MVHITTSEDSKMSGNASGVVSMSKIIEGTVIQNTRYSTSITSGGPMPPIDVGKNTMMKIKKNTNAGIVNMCLAIGRI